MRVLQVGCGQISHRWLSAAVARDDLEIAAVVDPNEEAARSAIRAHGLDVPVFASLAPALAACAVDLVFDCTPPDRHRDVTLTALAAGAHVFGEKPMAEEIADARAVIAAADAADRVYAVMQNRRFDPNIRALRRFLETGVIGTVTTVAADFFISPHFGGFRERMRHVLLKDMAIHTFDAARYLAGTDAVRVTCHEWNPRGSWYAHGASAVAVFEMTDDSVFSFRGSWCAEGLHTTWEASWRIVGDRGSILWDGGRDLRCQVVHGHGAFINEQVEIAGPELVDGAPESWHAAAIGDFVAAVADGGRPETHCRDNFNSLAMVLAAVESAELGCKVILPAIEAPP